MAKRTGLLQRPHVVALGLAALAMSGCATVSSPGSDTGSMQTRRDPLEQLNRNTFAFNQAIDAAVIKPLAKGYNAAAPKPVRRGISNALANLREPYTFVNDVLQARPCHAAQALSRFALNSSIGVAGFADVAQERFGLSRHSNDFGLTFASWGMEEGPYLVLPVLGPSNFRDTSGTVLAWFAEPMDLAFSAAGVGYLSFVRTGAEELSTRSDIASDLDQLDAASLDKYAAYRSAARQSRARDARLPACALGDGRRPR